MTDLLMQCLKLKIEASFYDISLCKLIPFLIFIGGCMSAENDWLHIISNTRRIFSGY